LIEEADAWFEYLATRAQSALRYKEIEPGPGLVSATPRAIRTKKAKLKPAAA
jgi:hypothetical protein